MVRRRQKQVLLQFKLLLLGNISSSNHHLFDFLLTWNSASDCCEWDSVLVVCESQQVTQLFLYPIEDMPEEVVSDASAPLFQIQTLTLFNIGCMGLEGVFPAEITNLTRLESLDRSCNKLAGSIPSSLCGLKELPCLNLRSISVPDNLCLSENYLIGTFPEWLLNSSITSLILLGNSLSGYLPDKIGEATCLETLILSYNDLSGPIPKSISNASLKELHLTNNRLSGHEFPNFRSLAVLDLSSVRFLQTFLMG
ncbi:hypothetical protein M5689_005320 [Euphorbia peplus]|nr:hypothetical protein M5689_005320 [Euphorbia peplus]